MAIDQKPINWWVSPERTIEQSKLKVYDTGDEGPVDFILKNPTMFGLTPDDIKLWDEPVMGTMQLAEKVLAYMDKAFVLDWFLVTLDAKGFVHVKYRTENANHGGGRIMDLISDWAIQENIDDDVFITMHAQDRQGGAYQIFAATLKAKHWKWQDEEHPPCIHCGTKLDKEELIDKNIEMKCPGCGRSMA